jgi:hypothetical protein
MKYTTEKIKIKGKFQLYKKNKKEVLVIKSWQEGLTFPVIFTNAYLCWAAGIPSRLQDL